MREASARARRRALIAQLPPEVWLHICDAGGYSSRGGKQARIMGQLSHAFRAVASQHPDLGVSAAVVSGADHWHVRATLRFVCVDWDGWPDFWLGGLGLLMGGGFHCCECGDVERDAAPWGTLPDTEGGPLRLREVVQSLRWMRRWGGTHGPGTSHSEVYWNHRDVLDMWPGAVCRRCYAECPDPELDQV